MQESLRELFPGLSENELSLAAENLDRYLEVAWEIMQEQESPQMGIDRARIPSQDARAGKVEQKSNPLNF